MNTIPSVLRAYGEMPPSGEVGTPTPDTETAMAAIKANMLPKRQPHELSCSESWKPRPSDEGGKV